MKITFQTKAMENIFASLTSASATNDVIPVLKMAYLEVRDGVLSIETNNSEVAAGVNLPAENAEPGVTLIAAARMRDCLSDCGADTAELEVIPEQESILKVGKAKFKFAWMDPTKFPRWTVTDILNTVKLESSILLDALTQVEFAVSEKEDGGPLRGVLWDVNQTEVSIVATDGMRLGAFTTPLTEGQTWQAQENPPVMLEKMSQLLRPMLKDAACLATCEFGAGQMRVQAGPHWIAGRLLEGKYPGWRKLEAKLENNCVPVQATMSVKDGQRAFRQCKIITDVMTRKAICTFTPGNMLVMTHGPNGAESKIDVPIVYDKEEIVIAIDPVFMSEILARTKAGEVNMTFAKTEGKVKKPLLIVSRPECRHMVQPMSL